MERRHRRPGAGKRTGWSGGGAGLVFHIKTGAFLGLGVWERRGYLQSAIPLLLGLELRVKQMKGADAAVVVRSRALIDVEVGRELGEESRSTIAVRSTPIGQ